MKVIKFLALFMFLLMFFNINGQEFYSYYYYENFGDYSIKIEKGMIDGEKENHLFYNLCNELENFKNDACQFGNLKTFDKRLGLFSENSLYKCKFTYNQDGTMSNIICKFGKIGLIRFENFVYDSLKRLKGVRLFSYLVFPGVVQEIIKGDENIYWEYGNINNDEAIL